MSFEVKPFISICIASYNYSEYLIRGFEAIKKQKFKDYEIIYLDDASMDDSVKIIQGFIKNNPDVNITLKRHFQNRGLLYTKTELLELATGKYVMLCDADDWMADNCLDVLASKAKESDADRIISQVYDINNNGKILQVQDFASVPSKWLWNLHHGCLYRREIIKKNNIKILLYPDDVYLTTAYNQYCNKVEWVSEPLYYWLVHEKSAGRKQKDDIEEIFDNFWKISCFIVRIKDKVQEKNDIEEINLLLIKLYYLQLFHELKMCSLTNKIKMYHRLKRCMKNIYPSYLNNSFLKIRGQNPARKYAMNVMRLGSLLEKMHLMWMGLIGYHLVSKWIMFDQ